MAFNDAQIDLAQHAALIDKLDGLIVVQLYQELLLINEYEGKIIKTDTWIEIDAGAGFGRDLVMIWLPNIFVFVKIYL